MIRSESEYRRAVEKLETEKDLLAKQRSQLAASGMQAGEIDRLMDPLESFRAQLAEEVEAYERLRRGELGQLSDVEHIGQLLVSARIARGMTQRELAERLGVHESQVSRDERNEYHGVSLQRAGKVLEVLGVRFRATAELSDDLPTGGPARAAG